MNEAQLRGALGLCKRAGRLQSGADLVIKAMRAGSCRLALLDAGAAANTVKKITDACIYYHIPYCTLPEGLLETACGREGVRTAAVLDGGFAAKVRSLTEETNQPVL